MTPEADAPAKFSCGRGHNMIVNNIVCDDSCIQPSGYAKVENNMYSLFYAHVEV